jgi:TRAP-type C4-dicarboxylate transport system permease small subunit
MKTNVKKHKLIYLSAAIVRRMNRVLIVASAAVLTIVMFGVAVDTVMRYFFDAPITGVKQLGEYALVFICFLGIGWVLTVREHIAITFAENWFIRTESSTRKYSLFKDIMCLGYSLPLLWLTAKELWLSYDKWWLLTGELIGVPEFSVIWVIPIGFLAISIQLVVNIIANILGIKDLENTPAKA